MKTLVPMVELEEQVTVHPATVERAGTAQTCLKETTDRLFVLATAVLVGTVSQADEGVMAEMSLTFPKFRTTTVGTAIPAESAMETAAMVDAAAREGMA